MPIALLSMASNDASSALLPATNTVIDPGSFLVLRDATNLEADQRCAAMCIVEAALSNASSQQWSSNYGTGALTLSSLDGGGAGHGKAGNVYGNVSVCLFEAVGDTCALDDHVAECSYAGRCNDAGPEYYMHVQTTACNGQVGPTLTFEWVKPPPAGSCALPANVTVDECWWSYPRSDPLVVSLSAVAPLPGVFVLLLGIVAMACIDAEKGQQMARAKRVTSIVSQTGRLVRDDLRKEGHLRMCNLLAYLAVWLGIAAHTIILPWVMADAESGEASEDACIARWMTVVASSALVLFGITLRVGEEMAADQRENDKEKWRGLRRAFAVAAFLNFLAVITSSAVALTTTENDNPAAVNSTKTEIVSVGGRFPKLAVELQVTRCRSTEELTWAQFWAIFVPWGLMHILGLFVHCERIFRRGLRGRFPSLFTLLLHGVFVVVTATATEPEAMTFLVRAPIGITLGWTTLITEVIRPTYQKHVRLEQTRRIEVERAKRAAEQAEAEAEREKIEKEQCELERRSKEEGVCSFSFMDADFIRDLSRTEHDGRTEWTAGPKWSGTNSPCWSGTKFPRMQEMEKRCPEAFKEHTISRRKAFRGHHRKEFCAVSHKWDESGAPDSTGTQLEKIREFLVDKRNQEVRWIWYDFWCLPQCDPGTDVTVKLTPTSDGFGVKWDLNSELLMREGKQQLVVDDVFDGGAAYGDGGLQKGDLLLQFDGADVTHDKLVQDEVQALRKRSLPSEALRPYEFVVRRTENGGKRTALEAMRFGHQLKHANLLYLGCNVLVLLDLSYQARFWTQFELWLSVQEGTDEGLKPATRRCTHRQRVHLPQARS